MSANSSVVNHVVDDTGVGWGTLVLVAFVVFVFTFVCSIVGRYFADKLFLILSLRCKNEKELHCPQCLADNHLRRLWRPPQVHQMMHEFRRRNSIATDTFAQGRPRYSQPNRGIFNSNLLRGLIPGTRGALETGTFGRLGIGGTGSGRNDALLLAGMQLEDQILSPIMQTPPHQKQHQTPDDHQRDPPGRPDQMLEVVARRLDMDGSSFQKSSQSSSADKASTAASISTEGAKSSDYDEVFHQEESASSSGGGSILLVNPGGKNETTSPPEQQSLSIETLHLYLSSSQSGLADSTAKNEVSLLGTKTTSRSSASVMSSPIGSSGNTVPKPLLITPKPIIEEMPFQSTPMSCMRTVSCKDCGAAHDCRSRPRRNESALPSCHSLMNQEPKQDSSTSSRSGDININSDDAEDPMFRRSSKDRSNWERNEKLMYVYDGSAKVSSPL